MKIWKLGTDVDNYDNLQRIESWEETQSFDGRSTIETWEPIKVKRMEPEKGLDLSDTPWLNTPIPVFSGCVKKVLENFLGSAVEFLPIMYPFVSDRLKEQIEDGGFQGFIFDLAWDSEAE